jgi:hypothetical protein
MFANGWPRLYRGRDRQPAVPNAAPAHTVWRGLSASG